MLSSYLMKLKVHRFDPGSNEQSPFTLLLTKGTKAIGYNFRMDQYDTLVCIEDDSISKKEKRTLQWIMDDNIIENLETINISEQGMVIGIYSKLWEKR